MASHSLDLDHFIGFRFAPTTEELIRIINNKNAGKDVHPMFTEYDDLFGRPPEPLEECYCLTKLKLVPGNKVNRTLRDGTGRFWKNIKPDFVSDDNNNVIGLVTQLRLFLISENTKTPTEWHVLEYRDTEKPEAGRYVLCRVYKLEKKNDSGRGYENRGQCSNAQPDWVSNAATNPQDDYVTGLLNDECFNQILLEFNNQDWPE